MSLHKEQSANLGASGHPAPKSPESKADRGGGVRLSVSLEDLHLDDSPTATTSQQARNGYGARASHDARDFTVIRNGVAQPPFTQQLRGVNRDDATFQLSSLAAEDGDVFTSPGRGQRHPSAPAPTPSSGLAMQAPTPALAPPAFNLKKQVSTPALASAYSSSVQGVIPSMQPVAVQRLRPSNTGTRAQVSNVDAQAYYPATACVFVANLPDCVRDSRLEAELTRVFSQYGIVFVKIRRDHRNMPFAFCQFTNEEDAHTAMTQARGTLIEGRPCRTEMVRANRSFVIYHVNGDDVTVDEARIQMAGFGQIETCEVLPPSVQDAMRIKAGVLVEYASFDPSRDVIAAYRRHPKYRVTAYDLKKVMGPKVDRDEEWLKRYDMDRRTIFVGNLPAGEQKLEELLRGLVEDIGEVVHLKVVYKDSQPNRPYTVAFGFVEFCRPDLADVAVQNLNGQDLCGCKLRVERKHCRDPQSLRRRPQVSHSRYINAPNTPSQGRGQDRGVENQQPEVSSQATVQATAQAPEHATNPSTPSHASQQASENTLPASARSAGAVQSASVPMSRPRPRTASLAFMPSAGQNYAQNYAANAAAYGQLQGTPSQFQGTPSQYQGTPSQFQGAPFQGNTQVGGGAFPATPQGTPNLVSPFPAYYSGTSTPYSWMTPYLQGVPAYYQAYSSSPSESVARANDDVETTPTRYDSGTTGRRVGGGQGRDQ
ncbi:hypothetical protein F5Y06DRAFT_287564 [Hypoxylon sp. FL0890]|nr:hypothetical protein F5Y06DRAFT_287564 [Hypoxylon sp. FL0890]